MSVVHYYDLPQVVHLSTGMGANTMNYPVSRSDIYFAKNVTNDIDFLLKDIDRKPVVLTETLVLRVADREAGKVLLTVPLTLTDPVKARYQATVPPIAIEDFALGFYSYSVTRRDASGAERLLFSDRGRTETGYVEVREGPLPPETTAFTITPEDLYPLDADLLSGAYPGAAVVGNIEGVMSFAIYGNHFTGTVVVEASLDAEVPTDEAGWFPMAATSYTDLTGVSGFSLEANVTWVRFKVTDKTTPAQQDDGQGSGLNGISCLACSIEDEDDGDVNNIDWPAGTPRGLVKIVYRA
jgi:hypothetical protein